MKTIMIHTTTGFLEVEAQRHFKIYGEPFAVTPDLSMPGEFGISHAEIGFKFPGIQTDTPAKAVALAKQKAREMGRAKFALGIAKLRIKAAAINRSGKDEC